MNKERAEGIPKAPDTKRVKLDPEGVYVIIVLILNAKMRFIILHRWLRRKYSSHSSSSNCSTSVPNELVTFSGALVFT